MLSLRKSRTEKATETLKEVVASANELLRDERLRSDLQSALAHGARATGRARHDADLAGMTERLASDKKLRKNLRAMLEDLDRAGDRVRNRDSHRARNVLILVGGSGVALAAIPTARRWIGEHLWPSENGHGSSTTAADITPPVT
jgi:transposase